MQVNNTKEEIKKAITLFKSEHLYQSSLDLFKALGYNTIRQAEKKEINFLTFKKKYLLQKNYFNEEKALSNRWINCALLFQLSKEELQQNISNFNTNQIDETIIESYLFFAIDLGDNSYSRTDLSVITREINKVFAMPVMILFHHNSKLSLAVINRRLNKKNENRDVLEKVTLIKDIEISNPHRAHIDILYDLSFKELLTKYKFSNFVELHKAWQKTLDISVLNKRFFNELSNWFFWAVAETVWPDDIEKKKEIRNVNNIIRLITRLIFVWFLKEKQLVESKLFDSQFLNSIVKDFLSNNAAGNYYNAILQNLFFGTINQKTNERGFAEDHERRNKLDQGIKNLYRYTDNFLIQKSDVLGLFSKVPFLNGGLFDCLDKFDDKKKTQIFVDGFTRVTSKKAFVPDFLFFSQEIEYDLNKSYGTKNKKYKVKGIIELLKNYKFTVAENTPIEEEVALDPELLGKVFENLLANFNPETQTTARKNSGSFYTPREIVNYMVDEAIVEYLMQHVNLEGNDKEVRLKSLLSYTDHIPFFSDSETDLLIDAIISCKTIDPACGSGAFPMGILHKMVYILHKLDQDNKKLVLKLESKIIDEEVRKLENDKALINQLNDTQVRKRAEEAVKERTSELKNVAYGKNYADDYVRKLYLIENCIYGIDIQPIAVQISKLRFFISLIIDQEKGDEKNNFGFRSLPNLETKFVAANTLIGLKIPTLDLFTEDNPLSDLQLKLKRVRHLYFEAKSRDEKIKYQREDRILREKISEQIKQQLKQKNDVELKELQLKIEIERNRLSAIELEKDNIKTYETSNIFGEIRNNTVNNNAKRINKQKQILSELEKRYKRTDISSNTEIIKTADNIASFDPYDQNRSADWFESEWMFGQDVKNGFHIVIGNPPYVVSKDKTLKTIYKDSVYGRPNLYGYFIHCSLERLLSRNGILSFINPKTLLTDSYFSALRKFILKSYSVNSVVNIVDRRKTFESVLQSCILNTFKASSKLDFTKVKEINNKEELANSQYFSVAKDLFVYNTNQQIFLVGGSTIHYEIFGKIQSLQTLGDMGVRFTTGKIQWDLWKNSLTMEASSSSTRLIWAENIQRYAFTENRTRKTPYISTSISPILPINNSTIIIQRITAVEQERRIISTIVNPDDFSLPIQTENHTSFLSSNESNLSLFTILGLLNSRFIDFVFRHINSNTQVSTGELEMLPVPDDLKKYDNLVGSIVRWILYAKENDLTSFMLIDRVLDAVFYELFLTEELKAHDCEIIKHLDSLKPLLENEPKDKKGQELNLYRITSEIYNPENKISGVLLKLLNVNVVQIIEASL